MERYDSDPGTQWSGQGGDTGLEEPMWNLRLGRGGKGGAAAAAGESAYPERSDEPDCIYYLRTGFCGYGARCRFNHPHDRGLAYGGARAGGGDYPERVGQPVCQYYMMTGSCKFGSSCKYHHPRPGAGSAAAVTLNFYGYPQRPGEKECSYYIKNRQCKFGATCKFHHPDPANVQVPGAASTATAVPGPAAITPSAAVSMVQSAAPPSQQFGVVAGGWHVPMPSMLPGSYIQGPYGPMLFPTRPVPIAGWTPYVASVSAMPPPLTQSTVGAGQLYGMPPISPAGPVYTGPYPHVSSSAGPSSSTQRKPSYPERPGQPECHHYLRTGECKYGSSCRYHHAAEWTAQRTSFALSPMGLPLRLGAPTCIYFMQHGVCKFGPTCKFNHPMGSLSYSPSASSLSDIPVAPYPVGSSTATLAPSSSSSDLRTEAGSGSKNSPTRTSSSPSVSSGLALSKSASIPSGASGQGSNVHSSS